MESFCDRYYSRLKLDPSTLCSGASWKKLAAITEAHLSEITFDNLAQHGVYGGKASLDSEKTARKILDETRGGFCFELNGLLGKFLLELGYNVKRLPAYVYNPELGCYPPNATHVILLVTVQNDDSLWYVDVAFGEPAIHPLKYVLQESQETPEGMISRLVHTEDNYIALQWLKNGVWVDRLRWKRDSMSTDKPLSDFQPSLEIVLNDESIFSKKLLVCKVSRTEKLTVTGNRLKVTTPRFGPESKQTVEEFDSVDDLRGILETRFGIPMASTNGLDMTKSLIASSEVWSEM